MRGDATIWYRHWLEMRAGLLLTAFGVVVLIGYTGFKNANEALTVPTSFGRELAGSALARSLDRDALLAWAAYASRLGLSAWLVALFLGGTGVHWQFQPLGSPAFTLTLPVSRRRIIATRLALTFAFALALETVSLSIHAALLFATGRSVPVAPLLQTFLLGMPPILAWVTVNGATVGLLRPFWASIVRLALIPAAFIPTHVLVTSLPMNGDMPWLILAAFLAIAGAAFGVTMRYVPRREYV